MLRNLSILLSTITGPLFLKSFLIDKSDIVFLGNSITHYGEWAEIFDNDNIKNRGISGDSAEGVYERLDPIVKGKPKKIFLLIGVNNLSRDFTVDSVLNTIVKIADKIRRRDTSYKTVYPERISC